MYYERYNQLKIQNTELLTQLKDLQEENQYIKQRLEYNERNSHQVQNEMDYSLVNDQEQLIQLQRATQPIPDNDDTSEDEFDLGDNETEAETVFTGK